MDTSQDTEHNYSGESPIPESTIKYYKQLNQDPYHHMNRSQLNNMNKRKDSGPQPRISGYRIKRKGSMLESISEIDKQPTELKFPDRKKTSKSKLFKSRKVDKKKVKPKLQDTEKRKTIPPDGGWGWLVCLGCFVICVSIYIVFITFLIHLTY